MSIVTWLHFGDLHASEEDGWGSLADFERMIETANRHLAPAVDFAYLPGDNANQGAPEQYARIAQALERLTLPWMAIPGDHDFEPGDLKNFCEALGQPELPISLKVDGRRCLFLDLVSAGDGGPDFRLGYRQTVWLKDQLEQSLSDPGRPVVFMHAFPGDLTQDAEAIGTLFADYDVACVDTGHTHYNELLNDGRVIYSATRSTGQVEEGPPGFSVHAVDGSVASWRFKAIDSPWPFVLITSPADGRLLTDAAGPDQAPGGDFPVRAKVFGDDVAAVTLQIDGGAPTPMRRVVGDVGFWTADAHGLAPGPHAITVSASSSGGDADADEIQLETAAARPSVRPPVKPKPGHDLHSVGAWPARGVLGTRLGPNKNGKAW
jgi:hypothetical protein